jgi:hypothetical protein
MNYEIIAIVIGPIIAVFTVILEYIKDGKEKLLDRKDLWLREHYDYLSRTIQDSANNLLKSYSMIYNSAIISIPFGYNNQSPNLTVNNEVKPLLESNAGSHLMAYDEHNELNSLTKKVDNYIEELEKLFHSISKEIDGRISENFPEFKNTIDLEQSDYEGYHLQQIVKALIDCALENSTLEIQPSRGANSKNVGTTTTAYYSVCYDSSGMRMCMFFSKNRSAAEKFMNEVFPAILGKFKSDLLKVQEEYKEIGKEAKTLANKLLHIIELYNSGFSIKGECTNCRQIRNVRHLSDLMPWVEKNK